MAKQKMQGLAKQKAMPGRGRPRKISRAKLVETASELGFAELKLSEVARRLNVTLQTLYNHVKDKDELLHLAAEVLERTHPIQPDSGLSWQEWWVREAKSLLQLYRRTPGLASILMERPLVNVPPLNERWEAIQIIAEREGFSPLEALWANMAVHEFIYAWAARAERASKQKTVGAVPKRVNKEFQKRCPRFAQAFSLAKDEPFSARFDMSLNALLVGLQRAFAASYD